MQPYNGGKNKQGNMAPVAIFFTRNSRAIIVLLSFLGIVALLSSDTVHDDTLAPHSATSYLRRSSGANNGYVNFGGAVRAGYFSVNKSLISNNGGVKMFHFAAVTDLDQLSRMPGDKLKFYSMLQHGHLISHNNRNSYMYSIEYAEQRKLISGHNEAGRGMELSELTIYQDRLLAFDDRTGDVYELLNKDNGSDTYVVPRFVITEGNGETDKGMKWEWASVKGNDLYLGSMGKEYTREDGSIANTNNLWISIINSRGEIKHVDWQKQYTFVRKALGASPPGYCIHEAVLWSEHMKKWMFLPRRVSSDAYDENVDEKRGSNKLLWVDEAFESSNVVDINMEKVDPLHGFSTVAFVPDTKDRHALALRSVEEDCVGGDESLCKQRTYVIVFDTVTGDVLMDEQIFSNTVKFEGIEFVDINTPEPALK